MAAGMAHRLTSIDSPATSARNGAYQRIVEEEHTAAADAHAEQGHQHVERIGGRMSGSFIESGKVIR